MTIFKILGVPGFAVVLFFSGRASGESLHWRDVADFEEYNDYLRDLALQVTAAGVRLDGNELYNSLEDPAILQRIGLDGIDREEFRGFLASPGNSTKYTQYVNYLLADPLARGRAIYNEYRRSRRFETHNQVYRKMPLEEKRAMVLYLMTVMKMLGVDPGPIRYSRVPEQLATVADIDQALIRRLYFMSIYIFPTRKFVNDRVAMLSETAPDALKGELGRHARCQVLFWEPEVEL